MTRERHIINLSQYNVVINKSKIIIFQIKLFSQNYKQNRTKIIWNWMELKQGYNNGRFKPVPSKMVFGLLVQKRFLLKFFKKPTNKFL